MKYHYSLRIDQDHFGQASVLNIPVQRVGGDNLKVRDKNFEITPKIHRTLSSTACSGVRVKKKRVIS